ncbi:helix-turn-helix domain-containing protein [Kitasatospora sp. NPDC085895]|uniref:helix-turn-helix domain-containing protein n=1 Tax=Kitasatospora sp. NPDC085895 TaxID=3155057 RepID=UPI00344F3831
MAAEDGARRYGRAMNEAFKACAAATGVTQKQLATEVHSSEAGVSRYLNGLRIAPADFLDSFFRFLETHGCGLDDDARRELHDLRREALRTSTADANRIAYLEELTCGLQVRIDELLQMLQDERDQHAHRLQQGSEEADRLLRLLADATGERDLLERRVEELRRAAQDTDLLARQLAEAGEERLRLEAGLGEKERQLQHATDYIRTIEADWERVSAQATALARELQVVRAQVEHLMNPAAPDTAQAVPALVAPGPQERTSQPAPAPGSTPGSAPAPLRTVPAGRAATRLPLAPPPPVRPGAGSSLGRTRALLLVIGLFLLGLGITFAVVQHQDAVADLRAPTCAAADADGDDCVTVEDARVQDRTGARDESAVYQLTVVRASGRLAAYAVDKSVYDNALQGTTVGLKVWKGRVVEIRAGGSSTRFDPIRWTTLWSLLLVWGGAVSLACARLLSRVSRTRTVILAAAFLVWTESLGEVAVDAASGWSAVLATAFWLIALALTMWACMTW